MPSPVTRRRFLARASYLSGAAAALGSSFLRPSAAAAPANAPRSLFDGQTLRGWHAAPRLSVPKNPRFADLAPEELAAAVRKFYEEKDPGKLAHVGRWEVIDGAIVGGHEPPDSMYGAYLISDDQFGDFELELDARPDWPADTGIMIRTHELASIGFQVLVDHRPKGCIGGVYGNSIGGFLVAPFVITGDKLPGYRVEHLRPTEPENGFNGVTPTYGATFEDFLRAWRVNDWNHFRIRCVGALPVITTWINGTKICELDTATMKVAGYDPAAVTRVLGHTGHLAFEVHDVSLKNPLGLDRWAPGAVCRWRNISIVEL